MWRAIIAEAYENFQYIKYAEIAESEIADESWSGGCENRRPFRYMKSEACLLIFYQ